ADVTVELTSQNPYEPDTTLGLYRASATNAQRATAQSWYYLDGSHSQPAQGLDNAAVTFDAPSTPGTYEVRLCGRAYGLDCIAARTLVVVGTSDENWGSGSGQLAAPVAWPATRIFAPFQAITLRAEPGATITYTLDGSAPTSTTAMTYTG